MCLCVCVCVCVCVHVCVSVCCRKLVPNMQYDASEESHVMFMHMCASVHAHNYYVCSPNDCDNVHRRFFTYNCISYHCWTIMINVSNHMQLCVGLL